MGKLANLRGGDFTRTAIELFIRRYGVDMHDAELESPADYATFNDFFTRALKANARPLAHTAWISPVDGRVSQLGRITGDRIFQAKGHDYSLLALLGGDAATAQMFKNGSFATIYLSPRDYHRIHMPCAGTLRRMVYLPGDLYSVNPLTAENVPGLFARNERLVCLFDTPGGPMAVVLVGATIVGGMATVWHGVVNPPRPGVVREWRYDGENSVLLKKSEEMGRFLLGSTVVLLWPKNTLEFDPSWSPAKAVRLGEALGQRLPRA